MGRSDPEIIARTCLQAVPIQTACSPWPARFHKYKTLTEFVFDLRQFVEKVLDRPLPDIQSNSLNKSLSFCEPMPRILKETSGRLTCKADGCTKKGTTKHLMLPIAGDPYSDRVCVKHFGKTEAFLSRGPCVDCGLKRKDHPVAMYWSLTRCLPCGQKYRHSDSKWLRGPRVRRAVLLEQRITRPTRGRRSVVPATCTSAIMALRGPRTWRPNARHGKIYAMWPRLGLSSTAIPVAGSLAVGMVGEWLLPHVHAIQGGQASEVLELPQLDERQERGTPAGLVGWA